jgi:hypothetical protein
MNVTGISAPTAPPVAPAITRVQAGEHTQAHPQHHPTENQTGQQPGQQAAGAHARRAPEPPPMTPLSTSEVAVMLGMAPPEVLLERAATSRANNAFDAYA